MDPGSGPEQVFQTQSVEVTFCDGIIYGPVDQLAEYIHPTFQVDSGLYKLLDNFQLPDLLHEIVAGLGQPGNQGKPEKKSFSFSSFRLQGNIREFGINTSNQGI